MALKTIRTIKILAPDNGVGLTQDAKLLLSILSANKEFLVEWVEMTTGKPSPCDMFIHCEILYHRFMHMAKHNVYFPNPEWFDFNWLKHLKQDSVTVLAKTRNTETTFKSQKVKTIFSGFTSQDLYIPHRYDADKKRAYIHLAGKSLDKGTKEVIKAFASEGMPELVVYSQKAVSLSLGIESLSKNVTVIKEAVPRNQFAILQNIYRFHICTSSYEGWGHYIHEAKSVGAIIITTNETPMNEFITPEFGYGCSVAGYSKKGLAMLKHVSVSSIIEAVKSTMELTDETIESLSAKSRKSFLDNDKAFRKNIHLILNNIFNAKE